DEAGGEVGLASPPIDEEILGEEGGGDHAQAVVHPAGGVELAHRGVYDRVAGATFAPRLERLIVVLPLDPFGFLLEGPAAADAREADEDGLVELAPDEFLDPNHHS